MPYQSLMGLSKAQLLIRFFHLHLSLKKGQSWCVLLPFTGYFKLQWESVMLAFPSLNVVCTRDIGSWARDGYELWTLINNLQVFQVLTSHYLNPLLVSSLWQNTRKKQLKQGMAFQFVKITSIKTERHDRGNMRLPGHSESVVRNPKAINTSPSILYGFYSVWDSMPWNDAVPN